VSDLDLARWIRPGDGVVVGQCCGEPTALLEALTTQAPLIGDLRLFAGMTFTSLLAEPVAGLQVSSYGALGQTAKIPGLQIVRCHFSALPRLFSQRLLPGDVALIQVAPPDRHGRCSLGVTVDYLADALAHARVVIAEINDKCPRTSGQSIEFDRIDHVVETSRPLVEAPPVSPGETEHRIATHVAELVQDGDTIQLGVGALPEAILGALASRRDMGVHSGMISDAVLDLIEAGAVTNARKQVDTGVTVAGAALGSARLFAGLHERDDVRFAPVSHTHCPAILAKVGPLCAINSAVEIDLNGQVNAESVAGRQIGAVGGQVDFLRAAAANGGRAILALPAKRIVTTLTGPVSTSRADLDWVVTEHGARSLAGMTDAARERALLEIGGGEGG
jgi:acyl-CoA hydrolase